MTELHKTLTSVKGAAVMINIVVGAGLLALPGLAVDVAGDHAIWAWLVCAAASLPLLLVLTIMGRRHPHAGGVAHFARLSMGEAGFVIASLIFLGAVAVGLPAIGLTGGYYIVEHFGGSPTIIGGVIVSLAAASHLISSEVSSRISAFFASLILATLFFLLLVGGLGADWTSQAIDVAPLHSVDLGTALLPFMMIFFAFTGWEVAAGLSEEFKNPAKDFPKAMFHSFIAVVTLYVGMAFIVQAYAGASSPEAAFVGVMENVFGSYGSLGVSVFAGAIIFANLMGAIWAVSRMVYSLAREGYFFWEPTVNDDGVPVGCLVLTAGMLLSILTAAHLGHFDIRELLALAGQNFFVLYGLVAISLFRLSSNAWEKGVALASATLIAALVFLEGPNLWYTLCLAIAGFALVKIKGSAPSP